MTIKEILMRAADEAPERVALHYRRAERWQETSYQALYRQARRVSELLAGIGIKPGMHVAIFLENCPEWYAIYFGIVALGAIAVPVDVKLREQEVNHIFHDCGVCAVFCSGKSLPIVTELQRPRTTYGSVIVLHGERQELPAGGEVAYRHYEAMMEEVASAAERASCAFHAYSPAASDPASCIYTSGTTGRQKGAVLSHHNFLSNVKSCVDLIGVEPDDNLMLILPLHHVFAFMTTLLLPVYAVCSVSLIENMKTIKRDMLACRPTVMLAVPLLLEKMLARIMDGIEQKPVARLMYKAGLSKWVGKRVKEGLGGRLRLVISGGAPISPETLRSWQRLGFLITEGYGITETAPVITLNPLYATRVGTVGLPIDQVEVRIDQPGEDGSGEIIVRGPNVMLGYYNNREETDRVLRDGWYYTGDLGYFDEAGYLVISGRKKSLIVNREGKNIYPEEIEQQVNRSPFILESLALGYREPGDAVGERVGLIAVPDQEAFDHLEDETGRRLTTQDIESKVREEVRAQLQSLADYKRPRRIQVHFDEFEKTTTQKIKRYLYAIDTAE
jgi:long-chain acyl-CoA synthetase